VVCDVAYCLQEAQDARNVGAALSTVNRELRPFAVASSTALCAAPPTTRIDRHCTAWEREPLHDRRQLHHICRMLTVFYSPEYVAAAYAFPTTRKAAWVADSLVNAPISGVQLVAPTALTREQLIRVHDPDYVRAVETGIPRNLAESQGFDWDPGLWPMVLSSNGGAVAAALAALEHGRAGSLSSGLHHARYDRGAGFCTFNGLVIAAIEALAAGAGAVLILDFDAHCGGGTHSLLASEPRIWQADVSVNDFDSYDSSEHAALVIVNDARTYLSTIEQNLRDIERQGPHFDLCIYNAGMDPVETCTIGGLPGITPAILARREQLVFDWCRSRNLPVAFVLAGGYIGPSLDQPTLVALHRLTVEAAKPPETVAQ
jgi:acetoin utilization deacetylase AcuC-like enzyme